MFDVRPALRAIRRTALLSAAIPAFSVGAASGQSPADPDTRLREGVINAYATVCREETQALPSPASDRDRVAALALEPNAFCDCSVDSFRARLASAKVDLRDRPALVAAAEHASRQCAIESLRANFPAVCRAIISTHFGERALSGPHAAEVDRACVCTQNRIVELRPEMLGDFDSNTQRHFRIYRQTGELPTDDGVSMVSYMAACGLLELKRALIESTP